MSPTTIPGNLLLKNGMVITGSEKNPVDLYRSNVSLLLHGDGANGSTTIVDSSPSPKTVTPVGNAQISTAQSKFGGASIAFDGNGDYLSANDGDLVLGTGSFTVEAWVYLSSAGGYQAIVGSRPDSALYTDAWTLAVGPSREFVFFTNDFIVNSGQITLSQWSHLVVARDGSFVRGFINGQQVGSTATNSQNFTRSLIGIGATAGGILEFFNGYIDDLRITKGVARYTANFTPPTAPFPDI